MFACFSPGSSPTRRLACLSRSSISSTDSRARSSCISISTTLSTVTSLSQHQIAVSLPDHHYQPLGISEGLCMSVNTSLNRRCIAKPKHFDISTIRREVQSLLACTRKALSSHGLPPLRLHGCSITLIILILRHNSIKLMVVLQFGQKLITFSANSRMISSLSPLMNRKTMRLLSKGRTSQIIHTLGASKDHASTCICKPISVP